MKICGLIKLPFYKLVSTNLLVLISCLVVCQHARSQETTTATQKTAIESALQDVKMLLKREEKNMEGYHQQILDEAKIQRQQSRQLGHYLRTGELEQESFGVVNAIRVLSNTKKLHRPLLLVHAKLVAERKLEKEALDLSIKCLLMTHDDPDCTADAKLPLNLLVTRDISSKMIQQSLAQQTKLSKRLAKLRKKKFEFFSTKSIRSKHPAEMTEDEIKSTLKEKLSLAIKLLQQKEVFRFFTEIQDPFEILGAANMSEEFDLRTSMLDAVAEVEESERARSSMIKRLKASQNQDLKIVLGGRVAIFEDKYNSNFWCFRDGQWYWNSCAMRGGPLPPVKPAKIAFFAKGKKIEFDFANDSQRLDSLRQTQQAALAALKDSPEEFVSKYLSPYSLAKMSTSSGSSFEHATGLIINMLGSKNGPRKRIKSSLEWMLKNEPVWSLNNRAAMFRKESKNPMYFRYVWEFIEGRWRLSLD